MDQSELIKRILHIVDLKFALFQMDGFRNIAINEYNNLSSMGNGLPIFAYESVKSWDDSIEKQIKLIEEDVNELLYKCKQS